MDQCKNYDDMRFKEHHFISKAERSITGEELASLLARKWKKLRLCARVKKLMK